MVKSFKGYVCFDDEIYWFFDIYEGIEDILVIFENCLKWYSVEKEYV